MKIGYILLLVALMIAPVNACGIQFSLDPEVDMVIIADESTSGLASKLVADLGVNAQVFEFNSPGEASHELGHFIFDHNLKVLAVAYQDTVQDFIANNPEYSDQIRVSAAEEEEIEDNLNQLEADNTSTGADNPPAEESGFVIPFSSGLLVGLIVGLGLGAFFMKKKSA